MLFPQNGNIDGFRDQFIGNNIQSPYAYSIKFDLNSQILPDGLARLLSGKELYPQLITITPGGPYENILPVGYGDVVRQIPVGIKYPTKIQLSFLITRSADNLHLYDAFNQWLYWQTQHLSPRNTYAVKNRENSLYTYYWDRNKTVPMTKKYGEIYPMSLDPIILSSMSEQNFTPFSVTLVSNVSKN